MGKYGNNSLVKLVKSRQGLERRQKLVQTSFFIHLPHEILYSFPKQIFASFSQSIKLCVPSTIYL